MLEPPDLRVGDLLERARTRFGLVADEAEFLPVGNDSRAWAFRLSSGGEAWFVKVLAPPVNEAAVEVPRYLAKRGIEHLVLPVPTLTGAFIDREEPFSLVVYPFLEGESGGQVGLTFEQRTELGRTMRRIHDLPVGDELVGIVRREWFVPRDLPEARRIGQRVSGSLEEPLERAFAEAWSAHQPEIDRIVDGVGQLGVEGRSRAGAEVLCHADIHPWNVLVQPSGGFAIVDWNETVLAPRERDLMFVDGGPGPSRDADAFFAGYGEIEIDSVVIAYYRFEWVVEELADYGRRTFFMPELGDSTKAEAVELFLRIFEPGEVVDTALQAQDALGG